jgi:hypothetical protein
MARKKKKEEFVWSDYQNNIFDWIQNGQGNLVVEASAGAGKTATLIECVKLIPEDKRILLTAFNSDIATVLKRKAKDLYNVNVSTLHSLGRQMLQRNYPDDTLALDEFKYKSYLNTNIKTLSSINTYELSKKDYARYMSNNPGIIKVSNDGVIKAIRPGSAIISASGLDNKSAIIKVISLADNGLINNYTLEHLKVKQYDKLMIVAHPDDETLWGGANLYRHKYFIVCLTNGYNPIRANEFKKILNMTKSGGIILNYTDLQDNRISNWLEIQNGIIKDLTLIINYKQWEKIVTHGPEGTTGHLNIN